MSLNHTPSSERVHIALFGKRNAGKSSVINAITNQQIAIVSDIEGTTTDPIYKSMELLPIGPVVLIDTAGLDDEGSLGAQRIQKSYQVLNKTDVAVLIVDSTKGLSQLDLHLIERFRLKEIPFVVAFNKADLVNPPIPYDLECCIGISAKNGHHINELKELIASQIKPATACKMLVSDLLNPNDLVVLVIPIDSAAPKGRLILPQQQTIRDILDAHAIPICVQTKELSCLLVSLGKTPRMVITDSQAFAQVSDIVPPEIPLTSFSILFARYKGNLESAIKGAAFLDHLQHKDHILISEGCTHHRQCEDIGTVKLPQWITEYTGKKMQFSFTSGTEFPEDLSDYHLIIHCGGCMLNEREMKHRLITAKEQNIPMTNYGIAIAYMNGILKRSVELFPNLHQYL
ncbi:MAG: [FeFe] hydrogenase H-cluster maturation GTPase HydF [Lachnospiraceae bacterium]|nr:[FeFe] hydrogenase H-cluster maturation GTPase HydF [Lachnospiraceae bacterium]